MQVDAGSGVLDEAGDGGEGRDVSGVPAPYQKLIATGVCWFCWRSNGPRRKRRKTKMRRGL